jgi:hypothetical protein
MPQWQNTGSQEVGMDILIPDISILEKIVRSGTSS